MPRGVPQAKRCNENRIPSSLTRDMTSPRSVVEICPNIHLRITGLSGANIFSFSMPRTMFWIVPSYFHKYSLAAWGSGLISSSNFWIVNGKIARDPVASFSRFLLPFHVAMTMLFSNTDALHLDQFLNPEIFGTTQSNPCRKCISSDAYSGYFNYPDLTNNKIWRVRHWMFSDSVWGRWA
jgi:hypothetical protein